MTGGAVVDMGARSIAEAPAESRGADVGTWGRSSDGRWRARTRLAGALLAVLAVAAACGGGDDGEDATPAGGPAEEVGEPIDGGRITIPLTADVPSLDPHKSGSFQVHYRIGLVYSKLLEYETGPDIPYASYNIKGDLAESWEVAEDGLTYTFTLRDDVNWQDKPPVNGRPFVADDVLATFERIRSTGLHAPLLENVASWEAPDDHTVVIRMSAPFAPLLNNMANHYMWILPREAVAGQINLDETAIGTGPYTMERREQNVEVLLRKNPDYFEEGLPHLDEVRFPVMTDQGARTAAFRSGEVDTLGTLSPQELEALLRSNPDTVTRDVIATGFNMLYMNVTVPPLNDVRVRKALSMALDRRGMIDQIYGGGEWASPVPPSMGEWALPEEEREELQPYDPEGAMELLAEAGFPNGFSTKMILSTAYGEQTVRQAQWAVEDLAEIGVQVEIEIVEYANYFGNRWPNSLFELGFGPQSALLEPDEWLRSVLHSKGQRNWYKINDPALDRMLDEQATILDHDERLEQVQDIQRYVLENLSAPIFTVSAHNTTLQQPWLKNYWTHPSYGYTWVKNAWIDRG